MIVLPKSVFYHVPKTGGSWIAEGINASFKEFEVPYGYGHASPVQCAVDKPSFCFVRNPYTWYKSYRNSTGEDIEKLIEQRYLTTILKEFSLVDKIGRFESLQADLRRFLDEFGEEYDRGNMFDRKPVNVSKGEDLAENIRELIWEKEYWVFKEFGYEKD